MPVVLLGKSLDPRKSCRVHTHNTWEIILNLDGCGSDVILGIEYPFFTGSIICIPPNIPHSKDSKDPFKDIYIQSTDFLINRPQEVLCFQDDEKKSFEMLMQLAFQMFHKKDQHYMNIVDSLYDAIQYILLDRLKTPIRNQSIDQLIRMIVENFCDPEYDVSDSIAALPYCKDYIRRMFRKEIGMTPVSYLNNLRLEHAKRLLKQQSISDYSVGEIALMCGFYDPRYFSRLFKRYTSQSPIQYAEGKKSL